MKVMAQQWMISKFIRHKDKIDPKPQYQRSPVWNTGKKQLLLDTILREYDVPKIYLRRLGTGAKLEYEVTDGQQRLRAIWEFIEDKYPLGEESDDLDVGDMSGKKYSELPTDVQDLVHEYVLSVTELWEAEEQEIRDLFLRLQEGVSLNPAEKRNAMIGGMRNFVADLAMEPHKVFGLTSIPNRRMAWDNLAAHIARLDIAEGPADIKAADLKKFYSDNEGFDSNGTEAKRIRKRMNIMAKVLRDEPPEMDIKWGFVDLYQTVMYLDGEYDLKSREDDLLQVYVSFEQNRRAVDDPADLLATGHDHWDRDLYDYIEAFQREGAKRKNLEIRRDIYLRRVHRDIPDLVPLDSKRAFTRDERIAIWRRDGGECQDCRKSIDFEEMHADHIRPHSKGGVTSVENGQVLCGPCNMKKGAAHTP